MSILAYFTAAQNPVARAEFNYQRYVINTSRSGRFWIILALVMLVPALLTSVAVFVNGIISPILSRSFLPETLDNVLLNMTVGMLFTMNIALYVVVQLVTTALGARSITREKEGRTWESLLLTNIDARQIIWGKWWATIRAMWGDQIMVAILRFGLFTYIIQGISQYEPVPPLPFDFPAQPVHILLLAVIATIYTIIDAAFTSALGVFLPLPNWNGSITVTLLLATRVLASVMGVAWFVWMFFDLFLTGRWTYLLIAIFGLLANMLAIWVVLRLAQVVAVRGQASPPARG